MIKQGDPLSSLKMYLLNDPEPKTDSIHHISLDVKEGEFLVLTGGSGCGKTTLTRLVNGLGEQFYEGTLKGRITLLGRNISE